MKSEFKIGDMVTSAIPEHQYWRGIIMSPYAASGGWTYKVTEVNRSDPNFDNSHWGKVGWMGWDRPADLILSTPFKDGLDKILDKLV